MILHIPHSSTTIPDALREQFVLSDDELTAESVLMTDAFTDELFAVPAATEVRFSFSRLLVDVERFPDDSEEPMSKVGMGAIYTRTANGRPLRRQLHQEERQSLMNCYETHHRTLLEAVERELALTGQALIIDCHSFPNHPLPCDRNQATPRPDFCIGLDSLHTPAALTQSIERALKEMGYSVGLNEPYAGTMVPLAYYQKDSRVASIMIEVNRALYMHEATGTKNDAFGLIKDQVRSLLGSIGPWAA